MGNRWDGWNLGDMAYEVADQRKFNFLAEVESQGLQRSDLLTGRPPRLGLHLLHVRGPDADLRCHGTDAQGVDPHFHSSAVDEIFGPVQLEYREQGEQHKLKGLRLSAGRWERSSGSGSA